MRALLALVSMFSVLAWTTGCAAVYPGPMAEVRAYAKPVVEALAIGGLTFRDERLAGRSTTTGVVAGTSVGTATVVDSNGIVTGSGVASTHGTVSANTATFETFENAELLGLLRTLIEDSRIARRVVPEARLSVQGVILSAGSATGVGQVLWNVMNSVTLLFLFGFPYWGSAEATVQLRVYDAGEIVARVEGYGTSSWLLSGYGIAGTLGPTGRQAQIVAAGVATRDAVTKLGPYLADRGSR